MMRTEDDLRAAFSSLEGQAPDADAVLRAVYESARGTGRPGRAARPRRSPGLLQQRPLRVSLIAAAAAAIAVALTLTLAGSPRAGGHGVPPPSLRTRLLAAIDSARADILVVRTPGGRGGNWVSPWYPRPGQQVRVRDLGFDDRGIPAKDIEYIFRFPAADNGGGRFDNPIDWGALSVAGTIIEVDHATRTWGEWHHANMYLGFPVNPAGIRRELASGSLHLIGRTTLRGRPAIELGMTTSSASRGPLRVTTAHLWVDARTYLPMRELLKFSDGKQDLSDFTFLPPTAANLAKLKPVIPAGYHRSNLYPDQQAKKKK
jgi:hypothetical protein